MGGNQKDELGAIGSVVRRPEEAAKHRNIHEIWNAVTSLVFIFGDNSTYRKTVSILNYSRCLRLADIKTWK